MKKNKRQKQEEFPKINWANNIDPNIQTAILLYDERVNTYHRMQEIDVLIDHQPELAKELVQLDIRNKQAHNELQSFNDKGSFLCIHSLVKSRDFEQKQLNDLQLLKKEKPELFMSEIANTFQNIKRIESNIRTKKYKSKKQLSQWQENLERAKLRSKILQKILKE